MTKQLVIFLGILIFISSCKQSKSEKNITPKAELNQTVEIKEQKNETQLTKLFEKANNAFISGNDNEAIKLYEQIIKIDNQSSDAYRVLSDIYNKNGDFEKSLDIYKRLIVLKPTKYQYHSRMAILLELFGKKKESEHHYALSRKLLKEKEKYYWTKTDSLSMAVMFIEVCDSVRGRAIIDSVIKRKKNNGTPENILREIKNKTHGEILKELKSLLDYKKSVKTEINTEGPISVGN